MELKWSPMIVHVAKSYIKCPNCLQETHVGAPPNLWEIRQTGPQAGARCDNCAVPFKIAKRIVFEDNT